MKANYISGCDECKDYIKVGDEITWSPQAESWVHERCAGGAFDSGDRLTRFQGTSLEDMGF